MKFTIHKTTIINKKSIIGKNIKVGPYSIIGPNVQIGNNVKIHSHVNIDGFTKIGDNTEIFPFASIGSIPQDLKYSGENSKLIIGKNNIIREHVTMNPGTKGGGLLTKVGNNCLFMVGAHVAHDCCIGNNVIMANNATLAGHVKIEDFAIIGGLSAIHQFVRIGKHAMVGGMSGVENDVIPYGSVMGDRAFLSGLNIIGLKRRGFNRDQIHDLRTAFRLIFAIEGTILERIKDTTEMYKKNKVVMDVVNFIKSKSTSRAICQPKQKNA
tara:strand:- start:377 stop:1180 length:804 start_codon:yes stop_codon:yes gene_type:complete